MTCPTTYIFANASVATATFAPALLRQHNNLISMECSSPGGAGIRDGGQRLSGQLFFFFPLPVLPPPQGRRSPPRPRRPARGADPPEPKNKPQQAASPGSAGRTCASRRGRNVHRSRPSRLDLGRLRRDIRRQATPVQRPDRARALRVPALNHASDDAPLPGDKSRASPRKANELRLRVTSTTDTTNKVGVLPGRGPEDVMPKPEGRLDLRAHPLETRPLHARAGRPSGTQRCNKGVATKTHEPAVRTDPTMFVRIRRANKSACRRAGLRPRDLGEVGLRHQLLHAGPRRQQGRHASQQRLP